MEEMRVKDLMVPLFEYSSVSEEASLYEAVLVLEEAHREFDQKRYRYRVILVHDKIPTKWMVPSTSFKISLELLP